MTVVLVMGLPFQRLSSLVEVVGGEVVMCCFQDALNVVWLPDWVVGVHLLKAFGKGVLDGRVEPFEEGCVVIINRDPAHVEEGGCNSQEVPIVFQYFSFTANTVLSGEFPEHLKALFCVLGIGSDICVELLKMCLEVFPISGLVARQCLPKTLQGVWDVVQDGLDFLLLGEPKAISKFPIFT